MHTRHIQTLCFTVLLTLGGCSDSGNPGNPGTDGGSSVPQCLPNFGSSQACGGTLSGTYRYRSACTNDNVFADISKICATATVSNIVSIPSGNLNFTSGSYALNVTTRITGKATIPKTCAVARLGCDPIAKAYNTLVKAGTASCKAIGTNCECDVSFPVSVQKNGKLTSGGGIADFGFGFKYHYCVQGDVLRYKGVPGSKASDQTVSYVLTK